MICSDIWKVPILVTEDTYLVCCRLLKRYSINLLPCGSSFSGVRGCRITRSPCKQGHLVFLVSCLAHHLLWSTVLRSLSGEKRGDEDVRFVRLICSWMCFCKNVLSCTLCVWSVGWMSTCGGKVVPPPPWLTSRLPPSAEPQTLPSPPYTAHPCGGHCQIQHSIHETNTNYHCSPLRGLQGVVQDVW